MTETADAVIIGTGVVGAAVAYEMAKNGWKTLSVDRNAQIGHGSTAGSCAIIRTHYSTLDGTALAWEGYHYWRDWRDYLHADVAEELARYREVGCLVLKTEGNGYLQKHRQYSAELGCPFEEWSNEKVAERLPIFSLNSFAPPRRLDDPDFGSANGGQLDGAVVWPRAGYVSDPALAAQNLAAAARRHGARFRLGAPVTEIIVDAGHVAGVRLGDDRVSAPVVINVGGPASAQINAMADVLDDMTIATRPLRQEVVHLPAPSAFNYEADGMVVSDGDIACYSRPEHGNHILVGSEDPSCDEHQWVDSDSDYNREFTRQWTTQAMRMAQRIPTLGIPGTGRGIVDLYDASTDWIPIYDKSSLPGFYMACGTSGNQFKNAPIAGKMMAALVDYCEGGRNHDSDPLQFELPYIKRSVNVGFYSRRRTVNKESSFSVLG